MFVNQSIYPSPPDPPILTPELWLCSNDYPVVFIRAMYPCTLFLLTCNHILLPNHWGGGGGSLGRHPPGFYPGTATKLNETMTSVLVWDTGWPNGDQRHPLVPVGPVVRSTGATCLAAAVACPHYGPNTTTSLGMGDGYIYSACKSNQMALNNPYALSMML